MKALSPNELKNASANIKLQGGSEIIQNFCKLHVNVITLKTSESNTRKFFKELQRTFINSSANSKTRSYLLIIREQLSAL